MSKYHLTATSCGNMDHNGNPHYQICPKLNEKCSSISECVDKNNEWIKKYNLGAGNINSSMIDNKWNISYNGRVWDESDKEIKIT